MPSASTRSYGAVYSLKDIEMPSKSILPVVPENCIVKVIVPEMAAVVMFSIGVLEPAIVPLVV